LLYRWDREPTRTASGQWGPLKTVIVGGVELPYFAHSPTPSGSPNVTYLRALPLCPIWPGFGINTAFYAVVLWLLFAVPSSLRRWRRIRRGLCPKCAYPVGTSEVCTECGMRVHKPRSQQSTIR